MLLKISELVWPPAGQVREKNGKKMRQNFLKLLKTHVEKMSTYRSLAMLMKTNELKSLSDDVDENKGERLWTRNRERSEVARFAAYQLAVVALTEICLSTRIFPQPARGDTILRRRRSLWKIASKAGHLGFCFRH